MAENEQKEKSFYTKTELEEFREIINVKLEKARGEYESMAKSLREMNENAADGFDLSEFGSDTQEKEQTEMFMGRSKKFMLQLEAALVRIENGTYGKCKITGKLIPRERLLIVPHTTSSVEGKNQEKR